MSIKIKREGDFFMAEDKRIRRTKKLLREALCDLMKQKHFKNITVSDIVRQADINRGTFYAYYQDVYDLREKVEDDMITSLKDIITTSMSDSNSKTMRTSIQKAVEYLEGNHELAYVLLKDGNLERKMIILLADCCQTILPANYNKKPDEWTICFVATGCMGIMRRLMMNEQKADKNKIIDIIDNLLCQILT